MTAVLLAAAITFGLPSQDVAVFPTFEVQGVAFTHFTPTYLSACLRVQGHPPGDGLWSLKILSVDGEEGRPNPFQRPMSDAGDVPPEGTSPYAQARLIGPAPTTVTLKGVLVHYQSVEEAADFPTVHLVQFGSADRGGGKAMRNWVVPKDCPATATTPRGLKLHYSNKGGWGYSGPGYDDMSHLTVAVDPKTLDQGVEKELAACKQTDVDRVDAYVKADRLQKIYEGNPKREFGGFSFFDANFSQDVKLSLHVIRRIVDRQYPFILTIPVQVNKEIGGTPTAGPVSWPKS